MAETKWTVTFQVLRQKEGQAPHFDAFTLEVDPDEYVLDGVERIWAFEDRSLVFRHACHHSTCGACGMRVNGVEKLTCITPIREVTQNGGTLRVEPLRNFPVISDLAVDMGSLYRNMDLAGALPVNEDGRRRLPAPGGLHRMRAVHQRLPHQRHRAQLPGTGGAGRFAAARRARRPAAL
jgi:succinate dehydrogenase / fumarate reductase iron-sulfur subunit